MFFLIPSTAVKINGKKNEFRASIFLQSFEILKNYFICLIIIHSLFRLDFCQAIFFIREAKEKEEFLFLRTW